MYALLCDHERTCSHRFSFFDKNCRGGGILANTVNCIPKELLIHHSILCLRKIIYNSTRTTFYPKNSKEDLYIILLIKNFLLDFRVQYLSEVGEIKVYKLRVI